jgi:histone H3/H4
LGKAGNRKFSLYDVEQFIREAGAERISEDAVLDLEMELENFADSIAQEAIKYAEHAGRKLIKSEDILLALFDDKELDDSISENMALLKGSLPDKNNSPY